MKKLFLLAMIVFITLASANALIDQPSQTPTAADCSNVTSLGLIKNGITLDPAKITAFFTASDDSLKYYCVKNILGLWDYDMYLEITYLNGTYVILDDTMLVYGVYPGRTTSQSILKQVDRTILGQYVWASPNYVSTSALGGIKTDINNQQNQQQILSKGGSETTSTSGGGIKTMSTPPSGYTLNYAYALNVVDKITPDATNYKTARTFSRLVLLDLGNGPQLVKLTLGVWV